MKELQVKSEGWRKFSLREAETEIGRLHYTEWFSFKAEITLKTNTYQIVPKGFWGTTIEVVKDNTLLLSFRMSWNGSIIIESELAGQKQDFVFKPKGFFRSAYVLLDSEGNELLALKPDYQWSKLSFDYQIETTGVYQNPEQDAVLCLVAVHCANYYMTMVSVAAT